MQARFGMIFEPSLVQEGYLLYQKKNYIFYANKKGGKQKTKKIYIISK
jgi:hypothetical protein